MDFGTEGPARHSRNQKYFTTDHTDKTDRTDKTKMVMRFYP